MARLMRCVDRPLLCGVMYDAVCLRALQVVYGALLTACVAHATGDPQRCTHAPRCRILRAFLIEEQKIVKQVLLEKMKAKKE